MTTSAVARRGPRSRARSAPRRPAGAAGRHHGLGRRDAQVACSAGRRADVAAEDRSSGTRPAASSPRENVIRRSAWRCDGGATAKVPRPGSRSTSPSSASRCIALRAVIRETPNSSPQLLVGGQPRSPAPSSRAARAAPARSAGSAAGVRAPSASTSPARSAPWTAAPIDPAHVPSSAGTSSTRRARSSSPAAGARPGSARTAGRRRRADPAAEDDPVGRDDGDHVGDADPEVAPDRRAARRSPARRRRVRARRLPRPSRSRRPRRSGRPGRTPRGSRGSRSRTTARRGRWSGGRSRRPCPSWPWWTRPSIAITPPTPGPERQPDHRRRAAAGTEPQLGEPERPRVVDEDRRQADRFADRARDRAGRPTDRGR